MSQPRLSRPMTENWENEGGSLRPSPAIESPGDARVPAGSAAAAALRADALPLRRGPPVNPADRQAPNYFGLLLPLAGFALLIWWLLR